MNLLPKIRDELEEAAKVSDRVERSIAIATLVAKALRLRDQDPILVGGSAVEFYTQGGYSTSDIDMVCLGGKDLIQIMEELGFEKYGKDFIHPRLKIYIEFPGSHLKPSEKVQLLRSDWGNLLIISREDLIVDRLCSFKFWHSAIDGVNALLLLESREYSEDDLNRRAQQEEVQDALDAIQKLRDKIIREKLNKNEASEEIAKICRGFEKF